MKLAYKEDLDRLAASGCSRPGCCGDHKHDILFIHARCHMSGGIEVSYSEGVLHVACAVCHATIVNVPVSSRHPSAYALAE